MEYCGRCSQIGWPRILKRTRQDIYSTKSPTDSREAAVRSLRGLLGTEAPLRSAACPKTRHSGHADLPWKIGDRPFRTRNPGRHFPCSEINPLLGPSHPAGRPKGVMPTRVFLFVGVIAVTTIICYLRRYRSPRAQIRLRPRKLNVPFNDSGYLTELDDHSRRRARPVPMLTADQIRAAFGNN